MATMAPSSSGWTALEFIARVMSHIPDKGQVLVCYHGLYADAHRGRVRKANRIPVVLGLIEEDPALLTSRAGPR